MSNEDVEKLIPAKYTAQKPLILRFYFEFC